MKTTITIKISSLRLINRSDFVSKVVEESTKTETFREAYEIIEAEYIGVFGRSRFSSYESFRVAKYREQNPKKSNQLSLF